ncbi:MAG: protein phosphatase 2C domain-containing protein [Thermoanaerobaculia bacterium]|nr:protein phosphatase 2C domain-containing protein [Thermoanaerobaculia bacterium]
MRFDVDGISDTGKVRTTNADRFLVGRVMRSFEVLASSRDIGEPGVLPSGPGGTVLVVADGIGSSEFGHEASALTVDTFLSYYTRPLGLGQAAAGSNLEDELIEQLGKIILDSDERLKQEIVERPNRKGMATTLTMAFVLGARAWIVHVGDSRAYLVRGGAALRLTKDQTVAQVLVDSGVLDADAAENSRMKHILASAVGGSEAHLPEVLSYRVTMEPGDALVLCTDGLNKHVTEERMGIVVADAASPSEACRQLVDLALDGGGTDNVTVIVGKLVGAE